MNDAIIVLAVLPQREFVTTCLQVHLHTLIYKFKKNIYINYVKEKKNKASKKPKVLLS